MVAGTVCLRAAGLAVISVILVVAEGVAIIRVRVMCWWWVVGAAAFKSSKAVVSIDTGAVVLTEGSVPLAIAATSLASNTEAVGAGTAAVVAEHTVLMVPAESCAIHRV